MTRKRTIAKYAIYLLILAFIVTGAGWLISTIKLPEPPPTISYSINIPPYQNATGCTYWLQVYGELASQPYQNQNLEGTILSLPYTITGSDAKNNTHCTLEVWYYTSHVDQITGNNTTSLPVYTQIADEHYELTLVENQP